MECLIVTGCTSGLGLELHQILASIEDQQRCCVFLGRNLDRLDKHPKFVYLNVNFSHEYSPQLLLTSLPNSISQITVISNAGMVAPIEKVDNLPLSTFSEAVKVNFVTPVAIISSIAAWAKKQKISFRILNVSSGAANRPIKGWSSYCSTKAAFKMFLDVLAAEQPNTEVIHFDPGVMNTSMQKEIRSASLDRMPDVSQFLDYQKDNTLSSPLDVAKRLLLELNVYL